MKKPEAARLVVALLAALALIPSCGRSTAVPAGSAFGVAFRSPEPNAGNVARTAPVVVAFNAPAAAATVNASTFTLSTQGTTLQAMVVYHPCNRVATLEPASVLQPDTAYVVALSAGITDESGAPLSPESFIFTTGPFGDTARPEFGGAQAIEVRGDATIVSWTAGHDETDDAGALVYDVFVSTSSGCFNFGDPSLTTEPGVTVAGLENLSPSSAYFVVVRARDRSGNSDLNTHQVLRPPVSVSFKDQVWPIVDAKCRRCHTQDAGAQEVPDMILTNAAAAYQVWVEVDASCSSLPFGTKRVRRGDSSRSFVWRKISETPPPCGTRMPQFSAPLSEADQQTIRVWIDEGAPNN